MDADQPPSRAGEKTANIAAVLRERAMHSRAEAAELSRRIARISFARLAAVAAILIAGAEALSRPRFGAALWSVAGLVAVGFILLVRRSRALGRLRSRALGRASVSEQGAYRAERDWPQILPQPWRWPADDQEWLRTDLDIVGSASLVQLLPAVSVGVGAPLLREWFAAVASTDALRERQASVRELIDAVELRDTLERHAWTVTISEARIAGFAAWGSAAGRVEPLWLAVARRALPVVTIASIVAGATWDAALPIATTIALVSIVVTGLVATLTRSRTAGAADAADVGARMAEAYAEIGALVLRERFAAPRLRALQDALGGGSDVSVARALAQLRRLSAWAEVRSSPMLHGALQLLLAWDCQIAARVERWRATHGASLGRWFAAFAEIECLAALAGLAYTNPDWTFPDLVTPAAPESPLPLRVSARGLAHPLLRADTRIANDVEIGPPGTLLLISGSNMSGKSTLLRAIGLNALLARTGGPVCAAAMSCPPMRLMTSLRVQDSLADGMSYFMAEALRLRDIIFAAEERDSAPVLYLVDEILRGTNSEERAVATRLIVARLLETRAIGIITTHDLGVFDALERGDRVRHAHFAEKFVRDAEGERLVFDYRLRPGPTTSRNALRLLHLVGLTPE